MRKDEVFSEYLEKLSPFRFDQKVSGVFDDMAQRSIPDYRSNLEIIANFAKTYYQPETIIYDLGCSTANLTLACADILRNEVPRIHGKAPCGLPAKDPAAPHPGGFERGPIPG